MNAKTARVPSLRQLVAGNETIVAPAALNPLMAKLAEAAGFKALYLSGGSLGWLKAVTEANLTLTEMIAAGLEITSTCDLPLILDSAGGWGDPMHVHRTIALAERTGFQGIEIEDQLLPKRVHHHVGTDHLVPAELLVMKIREAVAARTNPDLLVIARTDAAKMLGVEEAVRRMEACKKAGADVLFVWTRSGEEMRFVAERLPAPLMVFAPRDGTSALPVPLPEMARLGYRIVGVPVVPLLSIHHALQQTYAALAAGRPDPALTEGAEHELQSVFRTVGLQKMLDIEADTVGI